MGTLSTWGTGKGFLGRGWGELWGTRRNELTGENRLYLLVQSPAATFCWLEGLSSQPCRDSSGTSAASCTPPLTSPTAHLLHTSFTRTLEASTPFYRRGVT